LAIKDIFISITTMMMSFLNQAVETEVKEVIEDNKIWDTEVEQQITGQEVTSSTEVVVNTGGVNSISEEYSTQ
jgi:hypothetical protein